VGFRVRGKGFGVRGKGLGFTFQVSGFRCRGFRETGSGLRMWVFGCRAYSLVYIYNFRFMVKCSE